MNDAESLDHCSRCARVAPPPDVGPEGRAARGWVYYEHEETGTALLICAGCQTDEEISEAWPDFPPSEEA